MHLSDIHVGHHRGRTYLEKIVEETNQRKPDLVLITGDLIDSEAAFFAGALEPLARFSVPVYYVGGNHEKYVDVERTFALVKNMGRECPPQPGGRNPRGSSSWASTT